MRSFVVLGIGRFGASLAKELCDLGNEVLVIDSDEEEIQDITDYVTHAVVGDATDEVTLKSLGVRNFDVAVVSIGGDLASSILVTLLLKELGIKKVVVKAQSGLHAKVLNKVGADKIIFPERDMGIRVAQSLSVSNIMDSMQISDDCSVVEISIPKNWINKTLKELNVRVKYGISILAIKNIYGIFINPKPEQELGSGDDLVIIGSNEEIRRLNNLNNDN